MDTSAVILDVQDLTVLFPVFGGVFLRQTDWLVCDDDLRIRGERSRDADSLVLTT